MIDSDKDLHLDDDQLDTADDLSASDLADENYFDDDDDDNIFTHPEKRKKTSGILGGGIIILSLLAGASFYFYNKENAILSQPMVSAVAPTPVSESAPIENAQGVIPTPASDFEQPAVSGDSEAIVLNQDAPLNETAGQDVPAIRENISASPVMPISENTASTISEKQDDVAAIKAEEAKSESARTEEIKITEAEESQTPPAQDNLAPVTSTKPEPKPKNELEAARETINLPKKVEKKDNVPATVYFDAPKGKALRDIPPPSINPELEPGQSIIIVHKGNADGNEMIVERGKDNEIIESRLVNASRAASLGNNEAALAFYNEVYKKNPNDLRILMGRSVTLQKLGETQKAIEGYRHILDIEPDNPEALTNLMGLVGKTQPAVALQNLLDLKERYPRSAAVAAQLGLAFAESGNPQDGLKHLNAAVTLQPENPLHYFNMAVIYDRLKDRANAIKFYEQALDVYSINGEPSSGGFSREQVYDRLAALRGN